MALKETLKSIPVVGPIATGLARRLKGDRFDTSSNYWERRYANGGNSGAGSYNRLAHFKANFLNEFVQKNGVRTIIEFGSGDGAQLELADYPDYVGVDVSKTAIEATQRRFAGDEGKAFYLSSEFPNARRADLTMSLDVIYHLVEDRAFESYMSDLFDTSSRFVIIYSSDYDEVAAPHVRHRNFTRWVESNRPDFSLAERVPNAFSFDESDPDNTSFADFFVFERQQPA
jgi:hypothetical protein